MIILATSENTEQSKVGNAFTVILISSGAFETIQSKTHREFIYIIILHAHLLVITIKKPVSKDQKQDQNKNELETFSGKNNAPGIKTQKPCALTNTNIDIPTKQKTCCDTPW